MLLVPKSKQTSTYEIFMFSYALFTTFYVLFTISFALPIAQLRLLMRKRICQFIFVVADCGNDLAKAVKSKKRHERT